ncbi:MAG TPA: hypothetical protein VHY08_26610 [Bacillota bacterium]|nr:hypothetical protein [Bacillota bacterium]
MENFYSPKTLHLLIKANWLVDSITNLGGGYLIHLTYQTSEIDPEVLEDIKSQRCEEGVLGEIIQLRSKENRPVAACEVFRISDQKSGYRFELRILEVAPYLRKASIDCNSIYLCHYSEKPA